MAQSTASRSQGRSRTKAPKAPARSPELDMTRALAVLAAVVVVVAPGPLPGWLVTGDAGSLDVAGLLPAALATIAGIAIAYQHAAHASASPGWWTGRITRRVVVLVAAGLLLQLLVLLPSPADALAQVRFTGDLARIGVASGLGLLLVRLPAQTRSALIVALAGAHAILVHGAAIPAAEGGALRGWDAQLLGGRALLPIDPDGVTALAPTLALVLVGMAVGEWLRNRPRGAGTVGLLAAAAVGAGVVAQLLTRVLVADPAVWSPPTMVGGVGLALAGLAIGQAGTRRPLPDRLVATLGTAGRVTLPLWILAVVVERWFSDSPPVRWFVREVLWPPLGNTGASVALGLLAAAGLVRLGVALVDRGWTLRA